MGNTPEKKQTIIEQIKSSTSADVLKKTLEQKGAKTELRNKMQEGFGTLDPVVKDKLNKDTFGAIKSIYDGNSKKEYPKTGTEEYKVIQALASLHFFLNSKDSSYSFQTGRLAKEKAQNYIDNIIFKEGNTKIETSISSSNLVGIAGKSINIDLSKTVSKIKIGVGSGNSTQQKNTSSVVESSNTINEKVVTIDVNASDTNPFIKSFQNKIKETTKNNKLQPKEIYQIVASDQLKVINHNDILKLITVKDKAGSPLKIENIYDILGEHAKDFIVSLNGIQVVHRAKKELVQMIEGIRLKEIDGFSNKYVIVDPKKLIDKENGPLFSSNDKYKILVNEGGKAIEKVVYSKDIESKEGDKVAGYKVKLIDPSTINVA